MIFIIIILFFSNVDKPLRRHVEAFAYEAEIRGVKLPKMSGMKIKFKPINGMGGYWDEQDSTIWVSSFYRGEGIVEMIVFHELGHAIGKGHSDGLMAEKPNYKEYKRKRSEYLNDLFK